MIDIIPLLPLVGPICFGVGCTLILTHSMLLCYGDRLFWAGVAFLVAGAAIGIAFLVAGAAIGIAYGYYTDVPNTVLAHAGCTMTSNATADMLVYPRPT